MKIHIYLPIIFLLAFQAFSQGLPAPLLVSGEVTAQDGSLILDDDFQLQVYLQGYPDYYLTEESASCGYQAPVWFVELGNLNLPWSYGNNLVISIEDSRNHERVTYIWSIDSTATIPVLKTRVISIKEQITDFSLSERGVIYGNPVYFRFSSLLQALPSVELKIFSLRGTEIYQTSAIEQYSANKYRLAWHGGTSTGQPLHSGLYVYVLASQGNNIHSGLVSLKND